MAFATTILFAFLVIVVGGIILQIVLSKKENRWLGLILPSITFIYSIIALLSVAALDSMGGGEVFMVIALVFLTHNISTIILLGIYGACRSKIKQRAKLDKMKIQDLT